MLGWELSYCADQFSENIPSIVHVFWGEVSFPTPGAAMRRGRRRGRPGGRRGAPGAGGGRAAAGREAAHASEPCAPVRHRVLLVHVLHYTPVGRNLLFTSLQQQLWELALNSLANTHAATCILSLFVCLLLERLSFLVPPTTSTHHAIKLCAALCYVQY